MKNFNEGYFSEEELQVLGRLMSTSDVTLAKKMNRSSFLAYAAKKSIKFGSLRTILYNVNFGLSKREICVQCERKLSRRNV